jgi:hypothetical protein
MYPGFSFPSLLVSRVAKKTGEIKQNPFLSTQTACKKNAEEIKLQLEG